MSTDNQGYSYDLSDEEAQELGRRSIVAAGHRDAFSGNTVNLYHVRQNGWEFISESEQPLRPDVPDNCRQLRCQRAMVRIPKVGTGSEGGCGGWAGGRRGYGCGAVVGGVVVSGRSGSTLYALTVYSGVAWVCSMDMRAALYCYLLREVLSMEDIVKEPSAKVELQILLRVSSSFPRFTFYSRIYSSG